jgi:hypothetical protein
MGNVTAPEGCSCPNRSLIVRICHKSRHCLIDLGISSRRGLGTVSGCLRYVRRPKAKLDQEVPVIGVTRTQLDIISP